MIPLFPKAVFPDQKHCPECYNEIVAGRNLDVEFHKDKVSEFLTDLYFTNLDYTGLSKHSGERPHHLPKIQEDEVDDTNFLPNPVPQAHDRRVYTDTSATTTWFFTMGRHQYLLRRLPRVHAPHRCDLLQVLQQADDSQSQTLCSKIFGPQLL